MAISFGCQRSEPSNPVPSPCSPSELNLGQARKHPNLGPQ
ncbi:hypothetical protein LINGRAHAP2_LOCUS11118 [Linum grandiflorum]